MLPIPFDVPASLRQQYNFQAGQYLTLRADVNGENLRRAYSICTVQNDDELRICVKKVEQGRFSSFANESLKQGDILNVMPPSGKFIHNCTANDNSVQVKITGDSNQGTGFVAEVTILADGDSKTIKLNSEDSVLDKGIDALMDLPFACKSGICCTCRAKLLEGKVSMAVTTGLEQEEIDAGFI